MRHVAPAAAALGLLALVPAVRAQAPAAGAGLVPRFDRPASGLVLTRPVQPAAFFDVLGRRSAVFGFEGRPFEVWAYPLKLASDVRLDFALQDYPVPITGADVVRTVEVRPEATTFTYAHSAFTVRQTLVAPIDEPGVVMLLDVSATRPLTITVAFRPDLRLMWPAGLMTGFVGWEAERHLYFVGEETQRFYGIVGSPLARDVSVQPYQEEPKDLPTRFEVRVTPEQARAGLVPVVFAGSVNGRAEAEATYRRLVDGAEAQYRATVAHYAGFDRETLRIDTPDDRLDAAFAWAKVGVDKGLATNPMLGTGFLAGFRTAGASERPGFAWFFGRDALWTALASTAYGDSASTRAALRFLGRFQRADGKIPHEVSQSAGLLDWFNAYPYGWASADATPLFVIVHADLWRATGDDAFLRAHWPAIQKAYRYTAATDRDGNGLVENTGVGHGWVEGGALYPPHEELYLQGLWVEAAENVAAMATALGNRALAAEARAAADRTRRATEATYWLEDAGHYAPMTRLAGATGLAPDPGADEGQQASTGLARTARAQGRAELLRENTVLQAVPLWFGTLDSARAQRALDAVGAGALATDWGHRILSAESALYDPLSYHYGSVWPLFTGWASVGAYRYGRPHVGLQALMANALLTEQDALGYVTELLSGDYNAAFGRSSHHQVWSEAMVATPVVRGLLGLGSSEGGRRLRFAPQLPADWDRLRLDGVPAGAARYVLALTRGGGRMTVEMTRTAGAAGVRLDLAPAFPLDARVRTATVDGREVPFRIVREGDVQRAVVETDLGARATVAFAYDEGTDVFVRREVPAAGAPNEGLRVLRARAEGGALRLVVEGLGGRRYALGVRTPHAVGAAEGALVTPAEGGATLDLAFDGPAGRYVRRTITLPLTPR